MNAKQRPSTRTLHVGYNARQTDRAFLFEEFRRSKGFDLIGFYDRFCFVRFKTGEAATLAQSAVPPAGVTTFETAKQYYEVPYPQPDDDTRVPCRILHITHLPTNYTRNEIEKIFGLFQGFREAHFYGKYGYVYFDSDISAAHCRHTLRSETNLVVSFAKSAPKPIPQDNQTDSTNESLQNSNAAAPPRFSIIIKSSIDKVSSDKPLLVKNNSAFVPQSLPIPIPANRLIPDHSKDILSSSLDSQTTTTTASGISSPPPHDRSNRRETSIELQHVKNQINSIASSFSPSSISSSKFDPAPGAGRLYNRLREPVLSSFLDSSFIPKTAHVAASAQSFPQFQSKIDAEPGFAGYDWQGASSQDAKRKTAGWKPVSNTASLGIETAWVVDDGSKSTGIPIVEKKKPAWNPFLAGNVWGEKNKS